MLTGADLLTKVKELGDVSKTDLATACGYVSKKKDGSDRVNFTAFYEALLNAKGIELGGGSAGIGKGGRKLSYTAKVQGNGNLLVGKAYTAMLDLAPGDEFESKLGKKAIRLIPVGGEEEGEEWFPLPTDSEALRVEGFLMNRINPWQQQVMLWVAGLKEKLGVSCS